MVLFCSKRMIMKAIVIAVALASFCCASASSSPLASLRESRERIERFFAGRGRGRGADPSQLLEIVSVSGTRCLDGSPAGFYYALGEPGTDTLVINLEGGGACSSAEECRGRARTRYGSSRYWSEVFPADTQVLLSSDPEENPDFWSAHHVYVPYCTGDLHAGTRTEAGDETFGYYFSGARNFEAIVERFKSIVRLDAGHDEWSARSHAPPTEHTECRTKICKLPVGSAEGGIAVEQPSRPAVEPLRLFLADA